MASIIAFSNPDFLPVLGFMLNFDGTLVKRKGNLNPVF
jgi:hypothetical protein